MPKAVVDTTVLISAFLKYVPGAASHDLLQFAAQGTFELFLSDDILEETGRVLLTDERNRRRYGYPEAKVIDYLQGLTELATIVHDVPETKVVRDSNDDMILACALAAGADYLVSRDKDLLVIDKYKGIAIGSPEVFLALLRGLR